MYGTLDKLREAKDRLLDALNEAEHERVPRRYIEQIERVIARVETMQIRLNARKCGS